MALKLILLISLTITLASLQDPPPEGKRLIKYAPDEPAKWLTPDELSLLLSNNSFDFMDLTLEAMSLSTNKTVEGRLLSDIQFPDHPLETDVVRKLFPLLNQERMSSFIKNLSWHHFRSRNALFFYGPFEAEGWLTREINSTVSDCDYCSIRLINDSFIRFYHQNNIIVKLEGHEEDLSQGPVILAAHYDSIYFPKGLGILKVEFETRRAPGADDNGSGVAVLMEVLRTLLQSGLRLKYSVEFHFYTCKRLYPQGSSNVVSTYQKEKKNVKAVLNLDTIGFPPKKDGVAVAIAVLQLEPDPEPDPDFPRPNATDMGLNAFVKMLAEEYVDPKFGVEEKICAKECRSDQYPWQVAKHPAALLMEFEPNPHVRSERDTVEKLDFEQINEVAKLALAFVIELGVPDNEMESSAMSQLRLGWTVMGLSSLGIWMIN